MAPRHLHHVAEGGQGHALLPGQGDGFVDVGVGGDTDGAARSGKQVHRRRQEPPDAMAEDGRGVGAANLHQVHRPAGRSLDPGGQALGSSAVAELLNVAHGHAWDLSASATSARRRIVSSASASSTFWRA